VQVPERDRVREQPLLLVGLRDGDLVEIDPVRLRIFGCIPEEQVVRTDGLLLPVPLPPRQAGLPCRV
jgi:hypothetical protein